MQHATNAIAWLEMNKQKTVPQVYHCVSAGIILRIFRSLLLNPIVVMSLSFKGVAVCQTVGEQQHLYEILQFSKAVCFATAKSW